MVGQRFVQLLDGHPWFEISFLAASETSAGKSYGEACNWKPPTAPACPIVLRDELDRPQRVF